MARKYLDCREFPSEMKCTIAISADREDEPIDATAQHGMSAHGEHYSTVPLRDEPSMKAYLPEAKRF
ncbi:DUF1059 domain-containing protein [Mesorhizobium sp. M2D.F.Ca.ET.185.01.1.1]|nr:DUF1059 domain-containing protein [Mesorhizobium sp. M2D.F.Ca.ET.140.01.1.1]TGP20741.1 DUF1059 domain-containing protein [Mesorhizobium sp. M2D.F.Ca.ET.233.01.1.1]TGP32945.1 DUF1059 domain-containing protein [Mesorhizobium sp. M2D.F.Ca.ET.232.01.1.1]TGP50399.1 DUF1059 domain-containing protein [bacterium M00.F.Ca.ET.230.01.1.1]TGP58389.1 DUF1059 domain-containing protein [Mesorhizobium sp. M2D.F.Ca.ET.226.01.1.1]TGP67471.1 DUF1059 domain-containing protein [Mesorhizobium sp. M2D.F.Ca.ET.225